MQTQELSADVSNIQDGSAAVQVAPAMVDEVDLPDGAMIRCTIGPDANLNAPNDETDSAKLGGDLNEDVVTTHQAEESVHASQASDEAQDQKKFQQKDRKKGKKKKKGGEFKEEAEKMVNQTMEQLEMKQHAVKKDMVEMSEPEEVEKMTEKEEVHEKTGAKKEKKVKAEKKRKKNLRKKQEVNQMTQEQASMSDKKVEVQQKSEKEKKVKAEKKMTEAKATAAVFAEHVGRYDNIIPQDQPSLQKKLQAYGTLPSLHDMGDFSAKVKRQAIVAVSKSLFLNSSRSSRRRSKRALQRLQRGEEER